MSKGIHELSEAECKEYFPVVRKGIEIIVEQRAVAMAREQAEREAAAAIGKIGARLGGNANPEGSN